MLTRFNYLVGNFSLRYFGAYTLVERQGIACNVDDLKTLHLTDYKLQNNLNTITTVAILIFDI